MDLLEDDLRAEIEKRHVLLIVGAGVSIGATDRNPVASWRGLLEDGVGRCVAVAQALPPDWSNRVLAEIQSDDIDDLLSAAEKISSKLGAPGGGEYRRWLRETVGSLQACRPGVIHALASLNVPIATTNYDTLIEQVTGLSPVTWQEGPRAERIARSDERAVLHLHGHWQSPESVVLGIRSYEKVLGDQHAQAILAAVRVTRTLLFVGFGAGLRDPNFGAFLRWSAQVFAGSEYRHFRLARNQKVEEIQKQHPDKERIFLLPFGPEHADLAPYLNRLAPSVSLPATEFAALQQLSQGQDRIDQQREELEAKREKLTPGEFLRELSKISFDEWELGGKRRAWWSLGGEFHRGASALEKDERISIGTKLAQMMIEDDQANSAAQVLKVIQADASGLDNSDSKKLAFWRVQSRCWIELGAYDEAVGAIKQAMALTAEEETKERLQAELIEVHLLQGEIEKALSPELAGPTNDREANAAHSEAPC